MDETAPRISPIQSLRLKQKQAQAQDDELTLICRIGDSLVERAERQTAPHPELILRASKVYLMALQRNSKYVPAYLGLAHIAYLWGSLESALHLLNQATALNPAYPGLARLRLKLGKEWDSRRRQEAIHQMASQSLQQTRRRPI